MAKLVAQIPNNNIAEREYIIAVLFKDFLCSEPPLIETAETYCTSLLYDENKIVFRDHFWNAHPEPLSYLNSANLPHPTRCSNPFAPENDIVAIYGNDEIKISDNTITCGIDIWASAFFMLSRWEEYCNPTCDEHGRFPANESTALKFNFLHRPIVNEYVAMLRRMMKHLHFDLPPQKKCYQPVLTHDIDILQSNPKWKSVAGDLLKRHNHKMTLSRLAEPRNVYDTFNFLMDQSEKVGTKSIFFFMASDHRKGHSNNYLNTNNFIRTIENIKKRGHIVGFHAGHGTADNPEQYAQELQLLRQAVNQDIAYSRQHFLKFDMPRTFNILENNGIQTDFSLGYSQCEGFRCGTDNKYRPFDFLKRKTLAVSEQPLIVMDSTLNLTEHLSTTEAEKLIINYLNLAKKYNMPLTLLFHNTSFDNIMWKGWKQLYINIINHICQQS